MATDENKIMREREKEMDFKKFKGLLQEHVARILVGQNTLFITDIDKDVLWDLYLDSFPAGTNEIFRKRREYDCSCCRHFIRAFGGVVVIEDNKLCSIWDFETHDAKYQPVIDALNRYVKSATIKDVFIAKNSGFGTEHSHESLDDGTVQTWDHFRVDLPKRFVDKSSRSIGDLAGEYRDVKNVFMRSLTEISSDAVKTVLELIEQRSLYKGDEWKGVLTLFLSLQEKFNALADSKKDTFSWKKSIEVGASVAKIKNHSIGVLLTNISKGVELNDAVKRYEAIVAPSNYKRPKAIFTQKMIEQAQNKITEMGLLNSLGRRFATIDDITVNNILFANKDTMKQITGDVFTDLKREAAGNPKRFDKIAEVPIEQFIENILPSVSNMEVFLENRHIPNFMSIIAPENPDSKTMFKWNNNFSWAYTGNITDSMKERVKAAGGNVGGVLRFSIQWNEGGDNNNDLDAHCKEPGRYHIYYANKLNRQTTGALDVDILYPGKNVAVENITWTDITKMEEGIYEFAVRNFNHRGGRSGFKAEIEYDGQIYSYEYDKELRKNETVQVAEISFSRKDGIKFINSLPSTTAARTVWSLGTNQFHPVSVCMFSPNYWDEQSGIGHKHYMFIVKGCINDEQHNGFFNEFLREDLMVHKRVFEALGSKMRVAQSDQQLSGLGFSSTQRSSLICKIEGAFTRTIKLIF